MIKIRNIGPVTNADIELADKTVIVGPNGSGKTFLSSLVYFLISPLSPWFMPTISRLNLNIKEGEEVYEIDPKEIVEKEEVKNTILNYLGNIFNANLNKLITFGESEGIIENDKIKIVISKNSNPVIEIKNVNKVKVSVEWIRKEEVSCLSTVSKDKVIVIGKDPSCAHSIIANKVLMNSLVLEDWSPTAFVSTERVALFNLMPAIYNIIFSPTPTTPIKRLALDFLGYLIPGSEETYKELKFRFEPVLGMRYLKAKKRYHLHL